MRLPKLYPIVDVAMFHGEAEPLAAMTNYARELVAGGATLIQYRNKTGSPREMLRDGRELRRVCGPDIMLILNDRADLALAAGFDGVHVGQDDLSPEAARGVVGPKRLVGFSTHSVEQVRAADNMPVDYIAIGPVFATPSKADPDPLVGPQGVRAARAVTSKPLVAIGGITVENARMVAEAGADSMAAISALGPSPRKSIAAFLRVLG